MRGIVVKATGVAIPDKVVTNEDLAARLDTNDEWIVERTGIKERRIGGTTSGLAADAARMALVRAGREPRDVDALVLATTTPEATAPPTACTVQALLGMPGGAAFDLNAACSGFMFGLRVGAGLVATGATRVLVVGSDTLSRITDWDDRKMAVLVGDGAGAVLLEAVDGPGNMLSDNLYSDGTLRHLLSCDIGGYLEMEGKELFKRAVRVVVDSTMQAMRDANVSADDIAMFVPHQANLRIIQAVCKRIGIPEERTASVIDRYGNTSAASVPTALDHVVNRGEVNNGDLVLLSGFGGGMTWSSAVLRWGQ
ncbi:MAG: beta-ketoacyl-ACP synthase III [Acidimicrobiales bacterium]